jgi:hypothetical protein
VIAVNSLAIATGGTLDMTDNDMIIRAATLNDSNLVHAAVQDWIQSGRNDFDSNFLTNWNGTGIVSSRARTLNVAQNLDLYNLGVIRNSDLDTIEQVPYSTWGSQDVGLHDVLLKFTYTGDGNLDGAITFDDYAAMDQANLGWATGDVNNDGVVNFDDYAIVDQAFFHQFDPL